MREGWEYKKLGEIATFINGYPFKPSDWKDSGRKIIRIQNLNNPNAVYNYYDGDIENKYIVTKGDVLISWSGSLGVFEWSYDDAILNQHIFKVVFNKGDINKRFFEYVVSSRINEMKTKVHGITMQHITKRDFDVIPIPIPDIPEQERIVSELDLLSGIIEKKKAQLKEYDQLAQSIFYDMFGSTNDEKGWEIKKFGEVGTFQRGGGFLKSDFVEKGFPCIHYGQIHTKFGFYTYNNLTSISKELAISKSRIAHKGDVIIAITSEDVEGSCKSVAWMGDYDVAIGAHAAIFSHNQNPIYVSYYFRSAEYNRAKERYARGFKVVEIKPDDIAKIDIPLPPLPLQQSFAEKIEAIERQKSLVQQSISETETLFNSRMDYYFG